MMLELRGVTYRYPSEDFDTLQNLSFSVKEGEFVSIIGVSGCGKSTIFRLINRLLSPGAGEILAGGHPVERQKQYCGYMPQRDLLFPWRTVGENLRLPLEIRGGLSRSEMRAQVEGMLAEVGLPGCAGKYPGELSGGMRQRAAFGRTALTGSKLLLLDEPFSALDFLTRVSMQEWLLGQWQRHRQTVLFITHDVEEAIFLSGRILVVDSTPIRQLTEVPVPLPYPRERTMLSRPGVVALRERLLDSLRKQVKEG